MRTGFAAMCGYLHEKEREKHRRMGRLHGRSTILLCGHFEPLARIDDYPMLDWKRSLLDIINEGLNTGLFVLRRSIPRNCLRRMRS